MMSETFSYSKIKSEKEPELKQNDINKKQTTKQDLQTKTFCKFWQRSKYSDTRQHQISMNVSNTSTGLRCLFLRNQLCVHVCIQQAPQLGPRQLNLFVSCEVRSGL
jgi:hypothetical protein